MENKKITLFVSAGEPSGDAHASEVLAELKKMGYEVDAFGMGGSNLRAEGCQTIVDSEKEASVMGLTEVFGSLKGLIKALSKLKTEINIKKPDTALLVDFPDFNFFLLRYLKKSNIKVLYYVLPQVWAWRKGRISTIRKYTYKVATLWPFEESYCISKGVDASFVGNPVVFKKRPEVLKDDFLSLYEIPKDKDIISLVPGSRKKEINSLFKPMLEGFSKINPEGKFQAIVPVASEEVLPLIKELVGETKNVTIIHPDGSNDQCWKCLKISKAAIVASGTASLEAALAKVPFSVVYKVSDLTYAIGRMVVTGINHISLVNILAKKEVVKELLQDQVTAYCIYKELDKLLNDADAREKILTSIEDVINELKGDLNPDISPGKRVAKLIERCL